jgi:NAD(P)-dependent dehydrogenase (short-subunit alcohol dehydrogenase family)
MAKGPETLKTPSTCGTARSVLITGASTGIGEACALRLASRGWQVFAGVRRKEDGEALAAKTTQMLIPIILDVTNSDHIASAVERVSSVAGNGGLHGLVNNAGIALGGPLEFLPKCELERQFQVNVFGAVAVTQAFLPLIRKAHGRILFTSSNSGFWCEPFVAAYGATKHALEAIGDSLRVELHPWGIHVVLIEPGMIKTPIWDKAREAADGAPESLPPEARALYAVPIASMRRIIDQAYGMAASPQRVARAVQRALEARRPRTRYQVGIDSRLQYRLRALVPDRLRDRLARWVMGI